ncbi:chorismate mutase [Mycobacterium helveticum]|uniref:Chorismate mutase domain-containing protein n=1 Tax=Mycobacterium helveticum TaxID=2592811 RepID=A0A557XWM6_9MYCO|nr:chorismate mutase [Mycobacterium helveticum]TVS87983.1 hypothetical protein FPZ46_06625 [Mycobacterium helveticum]TVS90489.1 hypothetical protein FPZ47_09195 [Mycobacterium helveticum]
MSLAEVRSHIDQIDEHIVRFLAARHKLVNEAALPRPTCSALTHHPRQRSRETAILAIGSTRRT